MSRPRRSQLLAYGVAALTVAMSALWVIAGEPALGIPDEWNRYRSWEHLTTEPQLVPYRLAIQCMMPTPTQWSVAEKAHGPHTRHWIMVYANPVALAALKDPKVVEFPAGSVIAKEKLSDPPRKEIATGVAFMIKHANGWEFRFYPSPNGQGDTSGCVTCHRAGGHKDLVFGRYGQAADNN